MTDYITDTVPTADQEDEGDEVDDQLPNFDYLTPNTQEGVVYSWINRKQSLVSEEIEPLELPQMNSISGKVTNNYPDIEQYTAEIFEEDEVIDESPVDIVCDVISEKSIEEEASAQIEEDLEENKSINEELSAFSEETSDDDGDDDRYNYHNLKKK